MKKIITGILLTGVLAVQAQKNELILKADIKDMKAGEWVYSRKVADDRWDSVKTEQGGFHLKVGIPPGEGNIYILRIGKTYEADNTLMLYFDAGQILMKGNGPQFRDIKLSGSPYVQDYNAYNDFIQKQPQLAGRKELYAQANEAYKKGDTLLLAQLRPRLVAVDSLQGVFSRQWVDAHPQSAISAYVLYSQLRFKCSLAEQEAILSKLSPAARNNALAAQIQHSIETDKLTGIGRTALDFTQTDTAGRPVALKDFRGKYVLVDFWASWCHPCRQENPNVVKAFAAYKDRNFTVLGVSLDQPNGKEKWLKAINEDHLTWTQVSDLKFWNNAVAKQYDIQSIPANLLIGPDGKIIAKDLHGDELEKKLAEVLANAQPANSGGHFILKGSVAGKEGETIYLNYPAGDPKYITDSCIIRDGRFLFSGTITEPTVAGLFWKRAAGDNGQPDYKELFLEPVEMEIELRVNDLRHSVVKGSHSQDELEMLEKQKLPIEEEMKPLSEKYTRENEAYMAAVQHKKGEKALDSMKEVAAALHEQFEPYFFRMQQITYAFIASHPDSYVGAFQMRYYVSGMPLDSARAFYNGFSKVVKESSYGKTLATEIHKIEGGSPGSVAKDFSAKELDNGMFTLSSFKGKAYVLIDFWASWCVPCRHSNPHLIGLFHKYHQKGFEVVGVSDDDGKPEAWRKAVEKDGVGIWHNVLRGLDWEKIGKGEPSEKDISEKFGIHSLPTKILIDKNGIIIGRYGEGREDEASLDKKLEEIFL